MKDEVLPKNILMIGPTGVGKTEISTIALAEAPFIVLKQPGSQKLVMSEEM